MIKRAVFGIVCAALAFYAQAEDVRVALPGGGALVLPVPSGWKPALRPGPVPTLSLTPEGQYSFHIFVSPLILPNGTMASTDPESLRKLVSSHAQEALSQSVEKALPIQELRGGNAQGSYFFATDRAPKPGEFKYLTQGTVSIQDLPVMFTILTDGDASVAAEPAFRMLQAARRERP